MPLFCGKGWTCRAGEQRWSRPPQQSWMGPPAAPVAPAVATSRAWLRSTVWWRNTSLLIASTCEFTLNLKLSCCPCVQFGENELTYLCCTGRMSGSRTVRGLIGGIAACPPSRHTGVGVKLFSTCCLTMCGGSWLAWRRSWSNVIGKASPRVRLICINQTSMMLTNVFEYLEVIVVMWLADDEKISGNLSPVQQDSPNRFMLFSTLPTMLPKLGPSRVPPLTAGVQLQVSCLRGGWETAGSLRRVRTSCPFQLRLQFTSQFKTGQHFYISHWGFFKLWWTMSMNRLLIHTAPV